MITVANAPVSYGVFDLARPELVPPPGGGELLDAVAAAGYDAVDLGPRGLFGTGRALADALAGRGGRRREQTTGQADAAGSQDALAEAGQEPVALHAGGLRAGAGAVDLWRGTGSGRQLSLLESLKMS